MPANGLKNEGSDFNSAQPTKAAAEVVDALKTYHKRTLFSPTVGESYWCEVIEIVGRAQAAELEALRSALRPFVPRRGEDGKVISFQVLEPDDYDAAEQALNPSPAPADHHHDGEE